MSNDYKKEKTDVSFFKVSHNARVTLTDIAIIKWRFVLHRQSKWDVKFLFSETMWMTSLPTEIVTCLHLRVCTPSDVIVNYTKMLLGLGWTGYDWLNETLFQHIGIWAALTKGIRKCVITVVYFKAKPCSHCMYMLAQSRLSTRRDIVLL